jgi:putative aminopeptidase FrvX
MKSLIQKLVQTTAPSGHETKIREVIRSEIEDYGLMPSEI